MDRLYSGVSEEWPASIAERRTINVPEGNGMIFHSEEEVNTDCKVIIVGDGTKYHQD